MTDLLSNPVNLVLIPAYEPGDVLLKLTTRLLSAGLSVIVIDDGSGPDFEHIFNQLDGSVYILRHTKNQGKGAALKTGFRYIRDTYKNYVVITADSDGQHDVADILHIAKTYSLDPGSLLLGVRTFGNNNVPLRSKFGNTLTRSIFTMLTRQRLSDTQTGLRAFDNNLSGFMISIAGERFEYEMNVLLACTRHHVDLIELPIQTIYDNQNSGSHFQTIRDSWLVYKQVIKFASSSVVAFGIDFIMFTILLHLSNSLQLVAAVTVANIGARLVSASCNFIINKQLVFKHAGNPTKELFHYAVLAAGILLTNTLLLNLLTQTLHVNPYLAKFMTEISLFGISYLAQKNLVFAKKLGYSA